MISFTVIIASIVISMVITIGITLCCRFCSDNIETFIISVPKSLSENIAKLRDTERRITATNHPKKNNWLSKFDRALEEAHLLISREYSSSAHNNNDVQRSYICFGLHDGSPIKLQRQVKRLIVEGQGIIAASANVVAPDIESGITGEESFRIMSFQIHPLVEERSIIINETLEQVTAYIPCISDIGIGTSYRKQLELKPTCGIPDIEEETAPMSLYNKLLHKKEGNIGEESLELKGKQICSYIEEGSKVDESLEQAAVHTSGVTDIGEGTSNKKQLELEHTGGLPDIEEGIAAKGTSELHPVELVCARLKEGSTKEDKNLKRTFEQPAGVANIERVHTATAKKWRTFPAHQISKKVKRKQVSAVMDMMGDNGIRKIGIWGPGGVGKTAVAHTLWNKLQNTSSNHYTFSLVIYTSGDDLCNIQEAITARLKLRIGNGNQTMEVAYQIRSKRKSEKFCLILDDVWEYVDSSKIGTLENHMGSKIVLTTRSLEMWKTMETEAIKMDYLTDVEAWQLFNQHAGGAVDADGIRPLAETVYNDCGGLPLPLISVGSYMRGKTYISQWQNAFEKLHNSIPVNDIVLRAYDSLKLSYDSLNNDNLKSCFLYCSLLEDICNGVRMNDMAFHVTRWVAESESNKLKWISMTENEETTIPKYAKNFPNATTVMIHGGIDQGAVLEELVEH